MASWQCDFLLAPRAELETRERALPEWLPSDVVEDTLWWRRLAPPADPARLAARVAPPAPPWAEALATFGREDGNRIDVWRDRGRVESILVRVDLRGPDQRFIGGLVDLARALDAVLLRRDGLVVAPSLSAVAEALTSSSAARFVEDPASFLRRVTLGGPEDA